MQLSNEDVKKVATLARLDFTESEIGTFSKQLANIVTFVEQLSEVDTEGIEPMAHPLGVNSVLRSDDFRPGLSRDAALSNSPSHDESCFLVPAVLAKK